MSTPATSPHSRTPSSPPTVASTPTGGGNAPRDDGTTGTSRQRPTRRRRRARHDSGTWLRIVAAVLICLVMFFPFYWMVLTAFTTKADVYAPGLHVLPRHLTMENFTGPFERFDVTRWLRNSLVITLVSTIISVTVNLLAGYAFAKSNFCGRNVLFFLLVSTMMIPVQAIMIAQFQLIISAGLFGTIWAVVLPTAASAFGIFLARQFFLAIPDELLEAARIDGAGSLRTFCSVVLPLCKPLVAVLTLLSFMYTWNDFTWPLIAFFSNPDLFTMPIGIATDVKGQYTTDYGAIMAMTLVSITPMLVLFLCFQRYFVQGLARTGIR